MKITSTSEIDFKHVLRVCEELPPHYRAYGGREFGKVCALGAVLVVLDEVYGVDGEEMSADFMEQVEPEMYYGLGMQHAIEPLIYQPFQFIEGEFDITEMLSTLNDVLGREFALHILEMFLS